MSTAAIQISPGTLEQLHQFAAAGRLFAILDACDSQPVPEKIKELGAEKAVCLFSGKAEVDYCNHAPYIVAVDRTTLEWIKKHLWTEPWGAFVMAKTDLATLRGHFRRFLLVQLPDGDTMFFRYYDPRVLSAYLPTCEPWEVGSFLGPARGFATNDAATGEITIIQSAKSAATATRPHQGNGNPLWVIRREQFDRFEGLAEENFQQRLCSYLREDHARLIQGWEEAPLRQAVAAGTERARQYGITIESNIASYVALMFIVGPEFDSHPLVAGALADESTDPNTRMKRLLRDTPSEKWGVIRRETPDARLRAKAMEQGK